MLNSTIELITLAASNSLLMFCFCNFIIAVLLVGGSKPTSEYGQDSSIPPPTFAFRNTFETEGTSSTSNTCSVDNDNASTGVSELCAVKADTVESVEEEEKENDDGDGDGDGDGDDDELRRRVEEFIDKINEGWKAEKLRTSLLV